MFVSLIVWIVLSAIFTFIFGNAIAGVIVGGIATVIIGLLSTKS